MLSQIPSLLSSVYLHAADKVLQFTEHLSALGYTSSFESAAMTPAVPAVSSNTVVKIPANNYFISSPPIIRVATYDFNI